MRNLFKTIITRAEKIILVMAAVQQENRRNVTSLLKNEWEMSFSWLVCVTFDMVKGRTD